ncbi:MAG: hypothetical protein IKC69_02555 [Clostridia bacterium]|nr:hypothetical protein [Clostridia bacterium]
MSVRNKRGKITVLETVLYPMLAALTFGLQLVMELLPNVHLTGMMIMLFAAVFRGRGLFPLYLYVFLIGARWGFGPSWVPYLYVWLPLWGAVMLLPRGLPPRALAFIYPAIGFCHGLLFGTLYAPLQALLFGLNFHQTLAWIAAGLSFDLIHALGNLGACCLVLPLSVFLKRLLKKSRHS